MTPPRARSDETFETPSWRRDDISVGASLLSVYLTHARAHTRAQIRTRNSRTRATYTNKDQKPFWIFTRYTRPRVTRSSTCVCVCVTLYACNDVHVNSLRAARARANRTFPPAGRGTLGGRPRAVPAKKRTLCAQNLPSPTPTPAVYRLISYIAVHRV